MTSHLSERLLSKTLQITNVGEDAEKRESSCTIGGNATWSRHDGKQCSWFPKETKNRTIIRSSNSTPGYISGKNYNTNLKRYMQPNIHSSTYLQWPRYGSNPSVHQQTNG